MKFLYLTFILIFCYHNLNAATHTVTNGNDADTGSLRQTVADANSGDTIIFATNVDVVSLTSEQITINKNLTIIGKNENEKTIISFDGVMDSSANNTSRIFNISEPYIDFNISNLILENGKARRLSGGVNVGAYSNFNATNCVFRNNDGLLGGVAMLLDNATFTAVNCSFEQNISGTVYVGPAATFIAINCIFYKNIGSVVGVGPGYYEGNADSRFIAINCVFLYNGNISIYGEGSDFIAINCIFYEHIGLPISVLRTSNLDEKTTVYLYHTTLNKNRTIASDGVAVIIRPPSILYSYNSIYTGNTHNGTVSEAGQIRGTISGNGKNLIENETTVTNEKVFGTNEFNGGYIMPLVFAKSAPRLTSSDIEVPKGISADSIIFWLLKDLIDKNRPDTGFVTFGAVEYNDVGIRDDSPFDALVLSNITDRDFTIIFDNPETQNISIELIDLEGKNIFTIYEGTVNSGIQVYRVNENLANGIYFVKFVFKNKVMVRKVIVRK